MSLKSVLVSQPQRHFSSAMTFVTVHPPSTTFPPSSGPWRARIRTASSDLRISFMRTARSRPTVTSNPVTSPSIMPDQIFPSYLVPHHRQADLAPRPILHLARTQFLHKMDTQCQHGALLRRPRRYPNSDRSGDDASLLTLRSNRHIRLPRRDPRPIHRALRQLGLVSPKRSPTDRNGEKQRPIPLPIYLCLSS